MSPVLFTANVAAGCVLMLYSSNCLVKDLGECNLDLFANTQLKLLNFFFTKPIYLAGLLAQR